MVALGPDGQTRWRILLDDAFKAFPAIGGNGVIYMAGGAYLNALIATNGSPPLAKSSWPMFRANPRHTGRVNTN